VVLTIIRLCASAHTGDA